MDRVTTFSSSQSVIANLMAAEARQNTAANQVTTGKVASDLQGFGNQAEALTAANTLKTRVDGYVANAKTLSSKLDAQDLALGQVATSTQSAHDAIANAIATGSGAGLMASLQSAFSQAGEALNTQFDGQYLFAGAQVNTPPVAITDMSQLAGATTSDMFKNDQLKPVAQVDESTTLQTGFLASDVGGAAFGAFQQMQAFDQGSGGPLSGTLTTSQISFLQGMLSTFQTAASGATAVTAQNGLLQNRVDDATTTQTDRQTMLTTMIGGITDIDVASAASQLSQAQTAVQASAQVFSTLKDSSLLNYLK